MPRFFSDNIDGTTAYIEGEDARHIAKVLRARPGQEFTVSDMKGTDYLCAVRELSSSLVTLDILSEKPCPNETKTPIRLYQALPKGDKLEFIIQKAVELGAVEITPVLTSRCISRPSDKAMDKKLDRWQRIACEAAKQSGRGIIPQVRPLLDFEQAAAQMSQSELAILFYEESRKPLREALKPEPASVSVMVGSEGGFSWSEVDFAEKHGAVITSMGNRILRCETAPIAALSIILYHMNEV